MTLTNFIFPLDADQMLLYSINIQEAERPQLHIFDKDV